MSDTCKTCFDCKYLQSQISTDTWLIIDDVEYWCENENVTESGLEEHLLEDYPDRCGGFEAIVKGEV